MYLINQGGYVCKITAHWMAGGSEQAGTIWSNDIALGESSTISLQDFTTGNSNPLVAGADVWLYVWVYAGNDMQSSHFTYNPNVTPTTAKFVCSGTTTSDNLGFTGFSN